MAAPARNENATGSVSAAAAAAVAAMTTTTTTIATTTTTIMPTTMELPTDASSYTFLGKIGQGAFATVWKAKTMSSVLSMSSQSQPSLQQLSSDSSKNQQQEKQPQQQYVAVKVLNLDHVDSDLQEIRKEVQLMRLSLHPNILYCHTAFLEQTQLWVVTPFMNKGSSVSCLLQARRSLKIRYKQQTQQEQGQSTSAIPTTTTPSREELLHPPKVSLEPHILYILQQTLLGLQYIHDNGQIHRDIKGSNILLNGAGEVKIADFGVSGWLIPQNEKAKTFVGTPCWMAPEVMEQIHGYDYKADLWSLGITALELAKGYAPYAKYPPMKVLILTIQEDPPSLDTYETDDGVVDYDIDGELEDTDDRRERHRAEDEDEETWSPNFRQLVSWLLQKDPAKRPTCEELLQSSLLSTAVSQHVLESQVCAIVPDVGDVASKQQQQQQHGHELEEGELQYQDQDQQEQLQEQGDFMLGSRRKDAVWFATNSASGGGRHHQDRAPGTTWIFADGSQVLASNASLEERDTDDLLSELDQFCGATGGENYRKEAMTTTTETAAALSLSDSPPQSSAKRTSGGTIEDLMEEFEFKMEAAKAADEDDLDEFLDEFEKTTAGENFQRPR